MNKPSIRNLLCTICLLFIASNAHAQLVTIQFSGTVNSLSADAAGLVNIGNSFSGSYTYETSTADATASPIEGDYTNAIKALTLSVGGLSFSEGVDPTPTFLTDGISIINNGFGMNIDVYAASVDTLSGSNVGIFSASQFGFNMYLIDPTGTIYSNDSLPTSLSLVPFQNPDSNLQPPTLELTVLNNGTRSTFASANISSITTVPVPASFWLFGSGSVGLVTLARRKRA